MRHWILWRLSPSYRRRVSDDFDARWDAWINGLTTHQLSQTEIGRAALLKHIEAE